MIPDVVTIDYETHPIKSRPHYPPEPVGVAISWPREQGIYFAWGHPTRNNCRREDAVAELRRVWDSGLTILCHHAKFDLAVSYERMGLPLLPWRRVHDTLFLAYLMDPHARSLGLKELANDLLNWPPEEQDALTKWIIESQKALGNRVTAKQAGAYIWTTPGDLCGRYAVGDIARTRALFEDLYPEVWRWGMLDAYDRERRVLPIFMENEIGGMRVDMTRLGPDVELFGRAFAYAEDWLRRELRADGLNFDADNDVANILLGRGIVPKENWTRTKATKTHPNGQLSVSKENLLPEYFTGPNGAAVASVLGYRNRLKTCLDMFMRPWLRQATEYGGRITTNWNQTRGNERGGSRTGRPSTENHNFLNISKKWDGKDDGYVPPDFLNLPPLPLCRTYILPDEGEIFLHRDFDGQELRVFAETEQGDLWEQFQRDPHLDPHKFVGDELMRVAGREIERTKVKTLNFQGLYGGGIPALQRKLRCSTADARELKQFHDRALPGRKLVNEEIKRLVGRGLPIRTWGGRLYLCEPPGPDGRSKDYKLINYRVQGSAADLTKEALAYWYYGGARARFMVTVYDEINVSAHPDIAVREMQWLKEAMELDRFSTPMRSSPKHGPTWGAAKACPPEKGCPLCA